MRVIGVTFRVLKDESRPRIDFDAFLNDMVRVPRLGGPSRVPSGSSFGSIRVPLPVAPTTRLLIRGFRLPAFR